MEQPLRVLIVEDSESDAQLAARHLRKAGLAVVHTRVQSRVAMIAALNETAWDVIISDHNMPQFDAFAALEVLKSSGKDIPFVVVSGSIGEEVAVAVMKAGAHDYVMKEKLARLGPAVEREIREAEGRRARLRAEEALRESEAKYRSLYEMDSDAILLVDQETGCLLEVNTAASELYGYTRQELLTMRTTDISAEPDRTAESVAHPEVRVPLRWHKTKAGAVFPVEIRSTVFNLHGRRVVLAALHDITSRLQAEADLHRNLREKEALLREIHHRVKNNLQIVAGLLTLQGQSVQDPAVLDVLKECQHRIRAMSLVHAKLYESANLAEADFHSFVRELAIILLRAYAADPSAIDIQVAGADTRLGIDAVVPCSLIVNELLSNSLKHAFAPGQKGLIRVSLSRNDGKVRLSVADNGKGLPKDLDYRDTTSLGMRLVMMLVEQLEGTISLSRRHGTKFRIEFPEAAAG